MPSPSWNAPPIAWGSWGVHGHETSTAWTWTIRASRPSLPVSRQLGLPVFLHPQQTVGGNRLSNYYLSNLLGNPFDTAIAASHLILGGVLDQYPQLHVSLPHAGGALPILVGRLDAGWTSRPETRRLAQKPSSYLTRFSYDTVSHSGPVLDYLIANVGIDHLVLGSDYCFDMGYEQPVRFVESVGLGPARESGSTRRQRGQNPETPRIALAKLSISLWPV